MNYQFVENPFPFIIINDFFTEEELLLVWKELDFLTSAEKLDDESKTSSAKYEDGKYKKKNYGVFLDIAYSKREMSNILKTTRKIFDNDFMKAAENNHWVFRYLSKSSGDNTLVSYYEDGGYYDYHHDSSSMSLIIHLFKEPKKFTGGEIIFEGDLDLSLVNNRAILFPSMISHKVNAIKMFDDSFSGNGRYCISKFIKVI